MEEIIDRVVNGRVFKGVVALCGGRLRNHTLRHNALPRRHSAPNLDEAGDELMLEASPEAEASSPELRAASQHSYPDIQTQQPESQRSMTIDITTGSNITSGPPPAVPRARYIDIVQLRSNDGEMISAVTLTEKQIYQWNKILKHERTITSCLSHITNTESELQDLDTFISEIQTELEASADTPLGDREQSMQELEAGLQLREECENTRQMWMSKLEDARTALERPKRRLYEDWERTLEKYALLDPPSPTSSAAPSDLPHPPETDPEHPDPKTPTPSEAAQHALAAAREEAEELVRAQTFRLQAAQLKHDNWPTFYDDELAAYSKNLAQGETETTRTEFDNMLLAEQRVVVGEVGDAERGLGEAMKWARELGVVVGGFEQESNFLDHVDDGYRLSMEADMVAHVDRSRIERWMAEKEDRPNHSEDVDVDEWEARSVGLGDSISVVAEGRERERIERWRRLCEENRVVIPEGFDGEGEGMAEGEERE